MKNRSPSSLVRAPVYLSGRYSCHNQHCPLSLWTAPHVVCHVHANRSLRSKNVPWRRLLEYSWGKQITSVVFSVSSLRSDSNCAASRERGEAPTRPCKFIWVDRNERGRPLLWGHLLLPESCLLRNPLASGDAATVHCLAMGMTVLDITDDVWN